MKLFRKLHLWLSVPFGIIITLICFSGAMLIFEPEITRAVQKNVYYVASSEGEPQPLDDLMKTVKATLPDSVSITGVTVFADKNRTYQVNLSKPRRASMFIDQYSGQITGKYERIGFFGTMFKLHRWLLCSNNPNGGTNWGKLIVGISTIVFVFILITGIVIWAPRAAKKFWQTMTISFSKGWPGFWKGLHVAGGMWTVIIILAMALTGLTYSFGWYRTAFYAVCGVEHTPREFGQQQAKATQNRGEGRPEGRGEGRPEGRPEGRGEGRGEGNWEGHRGEGRGEGNWGGRRGGRSEFRNWQEVYNTVSAENPDAPQITISKEAASVTISNYGNARAADKYEFNPRSGEVTPGTLYKDAKEADKLRGWIYAIHTGSLGGIITRIIWLICALLGATLPLTGYYLWIRKSYLKRTGQLKPHRH